MADSAGWSFPRGLNRTLGSLHHAWLSHDETKPRFLNSQVT